MELRVVAALLVVGCSAPAKPVTAPAPAAETGTAAAAAPAEAAEPPEPFYWPALIGEKPAKAAPPELAEFGRLVGVWSCVGERRQADGTFKGSGEASTWTWFYTLGGRAVQDIFEPAGGGPVGTNLRIYDPETKSWEIRWVTGALNYFERITAKARGDDIVMRGEVTRSKQFPPHARKITFSAITGESFDWTYEATKPGGDSGWQVAARMRCTRTSSRLPTAR